MQQVRLATIKDLFKCETDACRRNVDTLIGDSIVQIGLDETIGHYEQWKILSHKLNNKSKLTCLGDKNHRLMLLEFVKAEAAQEYKSSYFNRAKIRTEYIQYLKKIGPYVFSEVITIVSKLKLIRKYHFQTAAESLSEDHINLKIREILASSESTKRQQNSNILKFIKIVEFEDREGLTKELGKLLRSAWAKDKEHPQRQPNPDLEPLQQVKLIPSVKVTADPELKFIESDYENENQPFKYLKDFI